MVQRLLIFVGLAAALPASVSAREILLEPSSKWVMDYAPDSCRLMRGFGTGAEEVVAQFIRYEPGSRFDVHVIGEGLGRPANGVSTKLLFGNAGKPETTRATVGTAGKWPMLFMMGHLGNLKPEDYEGDPATMPREQLARLSIGPSQESAVTSATLVVGSRTLVLHTGSLGPPMAALRKCTFELVKSWGLDPEQQSRLARSPFPKGNPGTWLDSSDYPARELIAGEQAIIRFRLMIDAAGNTTACSIQAAFAKGDFAKVTCDRLKQRAKFDPAQNPDGSASPSFYVGKVFFKTWAEGG